VVEEKVGRYVGMERYNCLKKELNLLKKKNENKTDRKYQVGCSYCLLTAILAN
jgi:hypothetical protein